MKPSFLRLLSPVVVSVLFVLTPVSGQELEPRLYSNTPVGVNALALSYGYSSGNVLLVPLRGASSIKIIAASGVATGFGSDCAAIVLAYQYTWGGKVGGGLPKAFLTIGHGRGTRMDVPFRCRAIDMGGLVLGRDTTQQARGLTGGT